ncbi:MAG: GNAT family N-acetyltransferase [Caldilinea sp.]
MTVQSRPMQSDDYMRMRALLIETVPITPIGFNWDMRRLDGKRFYNEDLTDNRVSRRPVQLWENEAGELVGYALSESSGDAHLQVHPDFRHIEPEMVAWAEECLAVADAENSQRTLEIFVNEYDALRQQILSERGYAKMSYGGMCRHIRLGAQPIPTPVVPAGYTLRTTDSDDMADCQRIADLLNAAFNRNFHNALEFHHFAKFAPCFHRDLDLVMAAPDGSFAAYVGVPYDEVNRRGVFEPVCTHPDHQRRGLARALMLEGFHRLRAIGAIDATVDTGDAVAANAFYTSMGFTEAYRGYIWRKVW